MKKSHSQPQKAVQNNLVAKHMEQFNRPATFTDRKKESKSGYSKYKHTIKGDQY